MRATMIEKARGHGLANVSFPGALPPADLAASFRASDVFVLPARSEGVPKGHAGGGRLRLPAG